MLGLSVACARCHDHKYDPIPTSDYYALYGIFSSTQFAFPGTGDFRNPKDFVPLVPPEESARYRKAANELNRVNDEIGKLLEEKKNLDKLAPSPKTETTATVEAAGNPGGPSHSADEIKALLEEARARAKELQAKVRGVDLAYAVSEGNPANARVQKKGDPKALGEEVPRRFLQALGGQELPEDEKGSGRRELADWVTSRDNPLFARVMVNRIWQHHFGRGIVASPNDFGARGQAPTHPELLDYLAGRFIESGWSIKAMHRLIMLTSAYQRASADNPNDALLDAENRFCWKFNSRRLSAEEIRDAMLATSGALDRTMGGPHPFPPEADWKYTEHKPYVAVYETAHRSVYLMQQRIKKQPFLQVFDGADPNASTAERAPSTTPLQALFMMNDPFAHAQADQLGTRIGRASDQPGARVNHAFELIYGRPASAEDILWAGEFLEQAKSALTEAHQPAEQASRGALAALARVLWSSNEFLYVD
jgi:hypothetical protein